MKKVFIFLLLFLFIGHNATYAQKAIAKWKLIWADEFNYNGKPDSTKWNYEPERTYRNKEKQIYTARLKNVYVENGCLNITGYKEDYYNIRYFKLNQKFDEPYRHYTSGSVTTKDKAVWKYAKIEVRCKIPAGNGTWPTVWLMGEDKENLGWPRQGEIDVMECFGRYPNRITGNVHFADPLTNKDYDGKSAMVELNKPVSEDFHVYSVIWDEHDITLMFDNKVYHKFNMDKDPRVSASIPFRLQPYYLLISLPLGGSGGGPIDDSILPATFKVDYVRVYKRTR